MAFALPKRPIQLFVHILRKAKPHTRQAADRSRYAKDGEILPSERKQRTSRWRAPVGDDARVVGDLVLVHFSLRVGDELVLLAVGADGGGALHRLPEVRVDRGAAHGLESLQLTRRRHVETLQRAESSQTRTCF